MFYGVIFFSLFSPLFADVQKNKIVQESIVFKENGTLIFKAEKLINDPKAFKTAVDIFFERYKDESIDGFIAMTESALPLATCLAYLKGVPAFKVSTHAPFIDGEIKSKSKYIIVDDILDDGLKIKPVIEWLEQKQAFVMEVCCLSEDLKKKGRENIPAQVMSIFLLKETR